MTFCVIHVVVCGHSDPRGPLFCLTEKANLPAGHESPQDSQEVSPPGHGRPPVSVTHQKCPHRHLKGQGPGWPQALLGDPVRAAAGAWRCPCASDLEVWSHRPRRGRSTQSEIPECSRGGDAWQCPVA